MLAALRSVALAVAVVACGAVPAPPAPAARAAVAAQPLPGGDGGSEAAIEPGATGELPPDATSGGEQILFAPDGRRFAIAGLSVVNVFDTATGEPRWVVRAKRCRYALGLTLLVALCRGGGVAAWRAEDGEPVARFAVEGDAQVSPSAEFVLSFPATGGVEVWTAGTGRRRHALPSASARPLFASWVDGDRACALFDEAGALEVWDVGAGVLRATCPTCRIGVTPGTPPFVSPDGRVVALNHLRPGPNADSYYPELHIREVASGKLVATLTRPATHWPLGFQVSWSPDGARAVVDSIAYFPTNAHVSDFLELFDAHSWRLLADLTPKEGRRRVVGWRPDGARLYVQEGSDSLGDYSLGPEVRAVDTSTGRWTHAAQPSHHATDVSWSPDATTLLQFDAEKGWLLRDAQTGEVRGAIRTLLGQLPPRAR